MITRKIAAGASAVLLLVGGATWTALASGPSGAAAPRHDTSWPVAAAPGAADEVARAARAKDRQVITVREVQNRDRYVDVGARGESPGDYFIFESRLMKRGEQVGRDSGRCLLGIRTFTCEATALLNGRGKIVVGGTLFTDQRDFRLAITGGTGEFKDARGQLTVVERKQTYLVFELLPR